MSPAGSTPEGRLAQGLRGLAVPAAGEFVFYDDFETGSLDWLAPDSALFRSYAVRDVAKHFSRPVTTEGLQPADAPTGLIESTLNQSGTAGWELSWDGSTWIAGDAGTAVAAGATVMLPPNSRVAPLMRVQFTASVAPTAGTLTVRASELRPLWSIFTNEVGSTGKLPGYIRRARERVYSGGWALEMKNRQIGPQVGDQVMAYRYFPAPEDGLLEFGVMVHLPGWDWAYNPDYLDLRMDVASDKGFPSYVLRIDGNSGTISYQNASGVFVPTTLAIDPNLIVLWHDVRLGVDARQGRYLYLEANGRRFGLELSGGRAGVPLSSGTVPRGFVWVSMTTASAYTEAVVIDRAFVRRIV